MTMPAEVVDDGSNRGYTATIPASISKCSPTDMRRPRGPTLPRSPNPQPLVLVLISISVRTTITLAVDIVQTWQWSDSKGRSATASAAVAYDRRQ